MNETNGDVIETDEDNAQEPIISEDMLFQEISKLERSIEDKEKEITLQQELVDKAADALVLLEDERDILVESLHRKQHDLENPNYDHDE